MVSLILHYFTLHLQAIIAAGRSLQQNRSIHIWEIATTTNGELGQVQSCGSKMPISSRLVNS
jgi:hypothetical protein